MRKQRAVPGRDEEARSGRSGADEQLNAAVAFLQMIVDAFARHSPATLSSTVQQRRVQGYLFGMLLAYGKQHDLPPPAVLGAMTILLVTRFGDAGTAADRMTHALINATQASPDDECALLIRRGIAGLQRWTSAGPEQTVHDFLDCVASLGTRR